MAKKKRAAPLEYSEVYFLGKVGFCLFGKEGAIDAYRLNRGAWLFLGTCETLSGAKSKIFDSVITDAFPVEDPQKWLKERKAAVAK